MRCRSALLPLPLLLLALAFSAALTGAPRAGRAANYPKTVVADDSAKLPYNLIGQLQFDSGKEGFLGSGSVVGVHGVLTAGHNVYDPDFGWSTDVEFQRGRYGTTAISDKYATRLYVLAGYQTTARKYGAESVRTFALDTAGLTFKDPLASGSFLGASAMAKWLTSIYQRTGIGYGAEGSHTGNFPLSVQPTVSFHKVYDSFYENGSIYFEGGMSGGPVVALDPKTGNHYVVGIIVSSSTKPVAGGIRIVDAKTNAFIKTYLKK